MKLVVEGGKIRFIYSDDLLPLMGEGRTRIARASHVEPVAAGWVADLSPVNGPRLGPFATRKEALDKEVAWLESADIPCANP